MKLPRLSLIALAVVAFTLAARAEVSPFRLRVEQVAKSDNEKFSKKQTRSLKIFISNSSKESAELKAKYVFFGRKAKENDVVKIEEGEKAISVGPLATAMVESGAASASSQEAHTTGSPATKGRTGGKSAPVKKVEASGDRITGFGVQVFQGEKMIAEYYDPPSGKEEWAKAYPLKAAEPAKKK